jgi:transcriptional regulator with XRE-family HTH domain
MEDWDFWIRVKKLIAAHRISQEEFAEYLDVPLATFKGWIHYDRIPGAFTAYRIATALGTSVEYLITGHDGEAAENRMKQTWERKSAAERMRKLADEFQKELTRI